MTFRTKLGAVAVILSTGFAGAAMAQDVGKAVEARQSLMQLYAHYLGTLGGMAKGDMDYDAAKAQAAADSLLAMMTADQSNMWPQGSDTEALGDKTAALPAIWTTYPAIADKGKAAAEAAAALASAAGTDLASLQAAMGGVGASCGACHKDFRQKR